MSDLTVAAGSDVALVFTFASDTDATPTIAIVDSDSTVVVSSTSTGVSSLGSGVYTYVWQVGSAQAADIYTATMSGEISGAAVSEQLTVTVTALPVYTTLGLLKDSLVSGGDVKAARDSLLQQKIASASRSIDDHCGRRFYLDDEASTRIVSPRKRARRDRDGDRLLVDDIGSATGLIVEVGNTTSGWSDITSSVELEPTDATAKRWPFTSLHRTSNWLAVNRVRVTARWGWPAVPQTIQEATLIQALRLFKRKDSPEGVLGSAEWGGIRVSRLDPDVAKLVERYVLDGFG